MKKNILGILLAVVLFVYLGISFLPSFCFKQSFDYVPNIVDGFKENFDTELSLAFKHHPYKRCQYGVPGGSMGDTECEKYCNLNTPSKNIPQKCTVEPFSDQITTTYNLEKGGPKINPEMEPCQNACGNGSVEKKTQNFLMRPPEAFGCDSTRKWTQTCYTLEKDSANPSGIAIDNPDLPIFTNSSFNSPFQNTPQNGNDPNNIADVYYAKNSQNAQRIDHNSRLLGTKRYKGFFGKNSGKNIGDQVWGAGVYPFAGNNQVITTRNASGIIENSTNTMTFYAIKNAVKKALDEYLSQQKTSLHQNNRNNMKQMSVKTNWQNPNTMTPGELEKFKVSDQSTFTLMDYINWLVAFQNDSIVLDSPQHLANFQKIQNGKISQIDLPKAMIHRSIPVQKMSASDYFKKLYCHCKKETGCIPETVKSKQYDNMNRLPYAGHNYWEYGVFIPPGDLEIGNVNHNLDQKTDAYELNYYVRPDLLVGDEETTIGHEYIEWAKQQADNKLSDDPKYYHTRDGASFATGVIAPVPTLDRNIPNYSNVQQYK